MECLLTKKWNITFEDLQGEGWEEKHLLNHEVGVWLEYYQGLSELGTSYVVFLDCPRRFELSEVIKNRALLLSFYADKARNREDFRGPEFGFHDKRRAKEFLEIIKNETEKIVL